MANIYAAVCIWRTRHIDAAACVWQMCQIDTAVCIWPMCHKHVAMANVFACCNGRCLCGSLYMTTVSNRSCSVYKTDVLYRCWSLYMTDVSYTCCNGKYLLHEQGIHVYLWKYNVIRFPASQGSRQEALQDFQGALPIVHACLLRIIGGWRKAP